MDPTSYLVVLEAHLHIRTFLRISRSSGRGSRFTADTSQGATKVARATFIILLLTLSACNPCSEDLIRSILLRDESGDHLLIKRRNCGATGGFVFVGSVGEVGRNESKENLVFESECHKLVSVSKMSSEKIV